MAVTCDPKTWVTYRRPSGPIVIPLLPARRLGPATTSTAQPAATRMGSLRYICQRSLMSVVPSSSAVCGIGHPRPVSAVAYDGSDLDKSGKGEFRHQRCEELEQLGGIDRVLILGHHHHL